MPKGGDPLKNASRLLPWLSLALAWTVLIWMWPGEQEGRWRGGAIKGTDLRQHELAGRLWNEGRRGELYQDYRFGLAFDPEEQPLERFNYVYSPVVAWTASWFDGWERESRYLGWWMLTLSAMGGCLLLWNRIYPEQQLRAGSWAYVLGCPSLFFVLVAFQNTTLTLLSLVSCILLLKRGWPFAAGLALAGNLFKPSLAPYIGVVLLVGGHWRASAGLAVGGLGWVAASLACGGWDLTLQWGRALAGMLDGGQLTNPKTNISLFGFVETLHLPRLLAWIGGGGLLIACALGQRLWRRSSEAAVLCGLLAWLLGASYVPHYEWLLGLPLLARCCEWLWAPGWVWWILGLLAFVSGTVWGVSLTAPVCAAWLLASWLLRRKGHSTA